MNAVAIAIFPFVFAVVGVLMYALCTNAKLAEVGRIVFACGFFFVTAALAGQVLRLAGH